MQAHSPTPLFGDLSAPFLPPPDSTPAKPRKPRKKACSISKKSKKKSTRKKRVIEYIQVPKHWSTEPIDQAMTTVVRPPTKGRRRKEIQMIMKCPMEVFVDLMQPMDSGDMTNFKWEDEAKTKLEPTRKAKTSKGLTEYKYTISKPKNVDKFWGLDRREEARRQRTGSRLVHRGLGSARLHLSEAAESRGERTETMAQVTGNVTVGLKVPGGRRGRCRL